MNAHFPSADVVPLVSPDRVRNEMQAILRYAQTRFTDDTLAKASGVKARCIKSYRVEEREPSMSQGLSILAALGRSDLNRIMALLGYCVRPLDESDKLQCGQVVAESLKNLGIIATAAADGRIDHTEERDCRKAADATIEALIPYSSVAEAV